MNGSGKMMKWITAVLIAVICVLTGWMVQQREVKQVQSDVITKEAPQLGPLGHLLLPDLRAAIVVTPDRPHDPFEVFSEDKHERITRTRSFSVSTNSLGFRGEELPSQKSGFRVLCVGDSVTFGWGVEEEEAYPSLLRKELSIEVVNAGVPALKPEHVYNYTKSIFHQSNPDLILIAMRPNWMMPGPIERYVQTMKSIQDEVRPIPIGIILPPIASFDPTGRQRSENEVRQIRRRLPQIPILDLTPVFEANMPANGVQLKMNQSEQLVVDRASGAVVVRGVAPTPGPDQPSLAPEIIALFEENTDIREPLFFDGGHPDKDGFVVFATEVARWIKQQNWM